MRKRTKEHNFVEAIEKLWSKLVRTNQFVDKLLFKLLKPIAALDIFADPISASVTSSNYDGIAKANLTVLGVAQNPFVE